MYSLLKGKVILTDCNIIEMNNFYNMLLKMKIKRPDLNVNRIMCAIYGSNYDKLIK